LGDLVCIGVVLEVFFIKIKKEADGGEGRSSLEEVVSEMAKFSWTNIFSRWVVAVSLIDKRSHFLCGIGISVDED